MDLKHLLSNQPLLSTLSKEFELLKKSGADVDYESWVRQRIREAARSTRAVKPEQAAQAPHASAPAAVASRATTTAPPPPAYPDHPTQLVPSVRPSRHGAVVMTHQVLPVQVETVAGGIQLAGEGLRMPQFVAPAQPGAAPARGTAAQQPSAGLSSHLPAPSAGNEPVFVSKLYAARGDVWSNQPETSTSTRYTGPRDQYGRPARPDWAAAALLQTALRGSSAVPHMQAAAERERRLALATSLAKEQVALGLSPEGVAARSGEVAKAEVAQVLYVAQQIAQQHEGLAKAVQETHEQLRQHQALLQAALQGRAAPVDGAPDVAPLDTTPVPDAWFVRAAQGSGKAGSRQQQAADAGTASAKVQRKRDKKEQLKAALRQLLLNGGGALGRVSFGGQGRPAAASSQAQGGPGVRRAGPAGSSVHRMLQGLRAQGQRGGRGGAYSGEPSSPGFDTRQQWDQPRHVEPPSGRPVWDNLPASPPAPAGQYGRRHTSPPAPVYHGGHGQPAALPAMFGAEVEEEAARVLAADRAAAAEHQRLYKLEALESRLGDLATKLEGQVERAVQVQQQQAMQQQQASPPQQRVASAGEAVAVQQQQAVQVPQLSIVELHRMMSQLQRMEDQEAAMRRKWLAPPTAPATSDPTQQSAPVQAPPGLVVSDGLLHTAAGLAGGAAASTASSDQQGGNGGGSGGAAFVQARGRTDPVTEDLVEAVLEARQQFLRHQRMRDAELMAASEPGLSPVDIVEDIADVLLEELLAGQAADLLAVCDNLGENLYDSEFETFL